MGSNPILDSRIRFRFFVFCISRKLFFPLLTIQESCPITRLGYARLLVEVDVRQEPVSRFLVKLPSGMCYTQRVSYEAFPNYCCFCKTFGHSPFVCKRDVQSPGTNPPGGQIPSPPDADLVLAPVPVVPSAPPVAVSCPPPRVEPPESLDLALHEHRVSTLGPQCAQSLASASTSTASTSPPCGPEGQSTSCGPHPAQSSRDGFALGSISVPPSGVVAPACVPPGLGPGDSVPIGKELVPSAPRRGQGNSGLSVAGRTVLKKGGILRRGDGGSTSMPHP
ncbi:hypothetical protein K2173_019699 [Erythroxylum novogranatense]|uniref:Uncharacterized protein n=1 Tax=Erythroxylum novogranatense TaxID=1862640 RepID=A0AAV8SN42_9ROSI|nr:hypothetical protein K2173_019699 [Erythroxylum novogranatense]